MEYTILIAEDHPLVRTALKTIISSMLNPVVILESESVANLQHTLETHSPPHLIILDIHIPGAHGFSTLLFLRQNYSSIPVLIVSSQEEESTILRAISYGASGFVPKSSPNEALKSAIPAVLSGKKWVPDHIDISKAASSQKSDLEHKIAALTPQQFRVLGMVSSGMLNKQIAYELNVSEATIKAHVSAILKKINIQNRTQAVLALKQLEFERNVKDQLNKGEDTSQN